MNLQFENQRAGKESGAIPWGEARRLRIVWPKLMISVFVLACGVFSLETTAWAEVRSASPDGFMIQIECDSQLDADATFHALVDDFSKWYDAAHSYSGEAENLSLDLKRQCMFETLPEGGFVRHMEIAYYHPKQRVIRMLGGLGPLQEMGVTGALTFAVKPAEAGGAIISMSYRITGAADQELNKLAPIVNRVLEGQVQRLGKYCESLQAAR